jgi:hypothetical protein
MVAGAGSDHDLPSAQVKMVAGTGVDHGLLKEQLKMVAGEHVNHSLRNQLKDEGFSLLFHSAA